jgi:predicted HicB family RNase H-like nuclease
MKKADLYTYRVSWSEEDGEHVGSCAEFPGLSWLDSSPDKALAGIRKLVSGCIRDMGKTGETLPEPISSRSFSGKFVVRVPPQLHRQLTVQAAESGISLNRLVAHKLSQDF